MGQQCICTAIKNPGHDIFIANAVQPCSNGEAGEYITGLTAFRGCRD